MSRYDLTDFEWRAIEPHLPDKLRGVPRVDDRRVLSGLLLGLEEAEQLAAGEEEKDKSAPAPSAPVLISWLKRPGSVETTANSK